MAHIFPAARGSRMAWASLGRHVRTALEGEFGAPVARAVAQPDGFSPGVAAVVTFQNGSRVFVKAVNRDANPDSPRVYRHEVQIASQLPPTACAPKLLWAYDDGDWVALAFEHIDGRSPQVPWERAELSRVLDALTHLARDNTPSAVRTGRIAQVGSTFRLWHSLVDAGDEAIGRLALVEPWAARNIMRLAALEAQWEAATSGDTLVHADVRADNLLLVPDRVIFVDWASAALGPPWLDLVLFLPSVAMQGGPRPSEVFGSHPLGVTAPADEATTALCALTGFFLGESLQPAPAGLPTLRAFQRGQGTQAAVWLRERTGWP